MSLTSPLRKEVLIDFRLKISPNVEAVSLDCVVLVFQTQMTQHCVNWFSRYHKTVDILKGTV